MTLPATEPGGSNQLFALCQLIVKEYIPDEPGFKNKNLMFSTYLLSILATRLTVCGPQISSKKFLSKRTSHPNLLSYQAH